MIIYKFNDDKIIKQNKINFIYIESALTQYNFRWLFFCRYEAAVNHAVIQTNKWL